MAHASPTAQCLDLSYFDDLLSAHKDENGHISALVSAFLQQLEDQEKRRLTYFFSTLLQSNIRNNDNPAQNDGILTRCLRNGWQVEAGEEKVAMSDFLRETAPDCESDWTNYVLSCKRLHGGDEAVLSDLEAKLKAGQKKAQDTLVAQKVEQTRAYQQLSPNLKQQFTEDDYVASRPEVIDANQEVKSFASAISAVDSFKDVRIGVSVADPKSVMVTRPRVVNETLSQVQKRWAQDGGLSQEGRSAWAQIMAYLMHKVVIPIKIRCGMGNTREQAAYRLNNRLSIFSESSRPAAAAQAPVLV